MSNLGMAVWLNGIDKGRAEGIAEGIEEGRAEGIAEGIEEGRKQAKEEVSLEHIRNVMESTKWSAQQAMDALGIPKNEQAHYASILDSDEHNQET